MGTVKTLIVFIGLIACSLQAQESLDPVYIQTDRYTLARLEPQASQWDPLRAITTIIFSQNIKTIGQAFDELLADTGITLSPNPTSNVLLNKPLPATLREIGPIPLSQALEVLAGKAWMYERDDLKREIALVLRPEMHNRYEDLAELARHEFNNTQTKNKEFEVPFRSGYTQEITPHAQLAIDSAIAAYFNAKQLNQSPSPKLTVTGISRSSREVANASFAIKRANRVASIMQSKGVSRDHIEILTDVQNFHPNPESAAVISLVTATNKIDSEIILDPPPYLQVKEGSFRTAVETVVDYFGYQIALWDVQHLIVPVGFAVRTDSLEVALSDLLSGYPVQAEIVKNTKNIMFLRY